MGNFRLKELWPVIYVKILFSPYILRSFWQFLFKLCRGRVLWDCRLLNFALYIYKVMALDLRSKLHFAYLVNK